MNTEKKLTAMQELIEHIGENGLKKYPLVTLNLIHELLKKEKQQIIDAGETALQTDFYVNYESVEDYYNQTFKN